MFRIFTLIVILCLSLSARAQTTFNVGNEGINADVHLDSDGRLSAVVYGADWVQVDSSEGFRFSMEAGGATFTACLAHGMKSISPLGSGALPANFKLLDDHDEPLRLEIEYLGQQIGLQGNSCESVLLRLRRLLTQASFAERTELLPLVCEGELETR